MHNSLDRFEYNRKHGTFKGWLRTVTRSRLNDFFKKQQRRPALNQPLESAADELQNLEDPEGPEIEKIWDEEWNRNLIQAALSRTKKLTSPKQFQIFKCHYIDEWTVRETCRTLGVNAAQVYMAKQRVGKIFREAVETLQEQVKKWHALRESNPNLLIRSQTLYPIELRAQPEREMYRLHHSGASHFFVFALQS